MYDTIHLRINSSAPYATYKDGRLPLQSVGSTDRGGVFGALRNARVALSAHCATFKGSIPKFYTNSKSQQYLSREQVADAISEIAFLFDVDESQMQVTRYDVAFNLAMNDKPSEYLNRMLPPLGYYKGQWGESSFYFVGEEGISLETRKLCLYDKGEELANKGAKVGGLPNTLRLELREEKQSICATSLYDCAVWDKLKKRWYNEFIDIPMIKEIQNFSVLNFSDLRDILIAEKIARGEENELLSMLESIPDRRIRHKARKKYEELRKRFIIAESPQEVEYRKAVAKTLTANKVDSVTEWVTASLNG